MNDDTATEIDAQLPRTAGQAPAQLEPGSRSDWQSVDRALRELVHRRAGIDAEEARWLGEAEALEILRILLSYAVLATWLTIVAY
jgi:hypothetical protein